MHGCEVWGEKFPSLISVAEPNRGLDPFPDPVGHFGAPWPPFWILEVLIEGMMESKNLFSKS